MEKESMETVGWGEVLGYTEPIIETASGRRVNLAQIRPEDICLDDIAVALARINRHGGHTRVPYTVAQHSVEVSRMCAPEDAEWGLMHDAAEAYVGDVVSPIKNVEGMRVFRKLELAVLAAIGLRFQLPPLRLLQVPLPGLRDIFCLTGSEWRVQFPESVVQADFDALVMECRDLRHPGALDRWESLRGAVPPERSLETWTWVRAEWEFRARAQELLGERCGERAKLGLGEIASC